MKRRNSILKLQQTLLTRREALRKTLNFQSAMLSEGPEQSVGDLVDSAIDSQKSEINSRLADVESRELARIEAALERIREGVYGSCEDCGGNIPLTRLRAVPYATLCIKCQRQRERAQAQDAGPHDWSRVVDTNPDDDMKTRRHEIGIL